MPDPDTPTLTDADEGTRAPQLSFAPDVLNARGPAAIVAAYQETARRKDELASDIDALGKMVMDLAEQRVAEIIRVECKNANVRRNSSHFKGGGESVIVLADYPDGTNFSGMIEKWGPLTVRDQMGHYVIEIAIDDIVPADENIHADIAEVQRGAQEPMLGITMPATLLDESNEAIADLLDDCGRASLGVDEAREFVFDFAGTRLVPIVYYRCRDVFGDDVEIHPPTFDAEKGVMRFSVKAPTPIEPEDRAGYVRQIQETGEGWYLNWGTMMDGRVEQFFVTINAATVLRTNPTGEQAEEKPRTLSRAEELAKGLEETNQRMKETQEQQDANAKEFAEIAMRIWLPAVLREITPDHATKILESIKIVDDTQRLESDTLGTHRLVEFLVTDIPEDVGDGFGADQAEKLQGAMVSHLGCGDVQLRRVMSISRAGYYPEKTLKVRLPINELIRTGKAALAAAKEESAK